MLTSDIIGVDNLVVTLVVSVHKVPDQAVPGGVSPVQ